VHPLSLKAEKNIMATLRLTRYEVKEDDLPEVCAKCGEPSVTAPAKKFSWHPSWVLVLILVHLLIYVIVALVLTKRMTVHLPFCERHRRYWFNRSLFIYGGLFGLLCLAGVGIVVAVSLEGQADNALFVCVGIALLFLVWLIAAAIVQSMSIRPTEITDDDITLTGLSRDFTDAVKDDRRERKEAFRRFDDRDRRGRRDSDDDRYQDDRPRRRRERDYDDDDD
jgi:hypothetical protein